MAFEEITIGDCRLINADCRDVLPTLGKFDLLLTDPPYGIGIDGQKGSLRKNGSLMRKGHEFLGWDESPPTIETFVDLIGSADFSIVWGGNYFALPASRGWLVWDKMQKGLTMSDGEIAWTNYDKPLRICAIHRTHLWQEGPQHPTQKPLSLMAWCLDQAATAKTVFDPFMGSGTTGVACAQSGRSFTGIERERKYFDIACERIDRAQAQGQLLPPEPVAAPEQQTMEL